MRKCDELNNPDSCMSRAADDEFTFVLLGRDVTAPSTIRYWIGERLRLGMNDPEDDQILEAEAAADTIEQEQIARELKTNDTFWNELKVVWVVRHDDLENVNKVGVQYILNGKDRKTTLSVPLHFTPDQTLEKIREKLIECLANEMLTGLVESEEIKRL